MKKEAFDELVSSVRQAGRIRQGRARPSRRFTYRPADVAAIRDQLNKSQSEFAQMIGVSVATLQNWEQGRRIPNGPALALLRPRRPPKIPHLWPPQTPPPRGDRLSA